ncbi:MAG: hypothetical protein HYX97_00320 [Chloroflexi bacterium]|nr:hypothetical protein [Chloroflexota bacterium]
MKPPLGPGILLSTDFIQSQSQGWELEPGWAITPSGAESNTHSWARAGNATWRDYTLRVRLNITSGGLHLNVRLGDGGRFYVGVVPGSEIYLARSLPSGAPGNFSNEDLKRVQFRRVRPGAFQTVTVSVVGNTVKVYVDNLLVIEYIDPRAPQAGRIGLEALDGSQVLVASVEVLENAVAPQNATSWTVEERIGDITLSGDQVLTITDKDVVQQGNITLRDRSKLVLRNAVLEVRPKDRPRAEVALSDNAALEATDSALLSGSDPSNLYMTAADRSTVTLTNSSFINVLDATAQSRVTISGSTIHSGVAGINEREGTFGIVQAGGNAIITIADSTIGSLALLFGADANVTLSGLKPGLYPRWSLGPSDGASFTVQLTNTTILPSILVGGMERGWAIFANASSRVAVSDSQLNKLVVTDIVGETLSFSGLQLNKPVNFSYRNIRMTNSSVFAQWGFFITDGQLTITDSDGFWTFVYGNSIIRLVNSRMLEFDPRGFTGTLEFVNATWCCAAEVIEENAFTIRGTVTVTENLAQALVWFTSRVTREFAVRVLDAQDRPIVGAQVRATRGAQVAQATTDAAGNALLPLVFTDADYRQPGTLTVTHGTGTVTSVLDFFASSPIIFRVSGS